MFISYCTFNIFNLRLNLFKNFFKMEPIKIKILKRAWTDDDDDDDTNDNTKIPVKKRSKRSFEKENKDAKRKFKVVSNNIDLQCTVLENSPVPTKKSNAKYNKKRDSSDDETDSMIDDLLYELKKSGVKLPNLRNAKKSEEKFNNSGETKSDLPSFQKLKKIGPKKALLKDFEEVVTSEKRKRSKNLEKISESELKSQSSEGINISSTDTSKEITNSCTIIKTERTVTTRMSGRRSSVLNETSYTYPEKTPVRRKRETPNKLIEPLSKSNKTPQNKNSTAKKLQIEEPKTPKTKMTEKLPTTPLEKARVSLHVSTVPECLPCRENEYNNILTFLENKLWDGIGGCMYISGVPGTGKTATVSQVIKHLQQCSRNGDVPEFIYIEINGMRLSNPRQLYIQLWQKLFDKKDKITPDRAHRLLDDWFSKSNQQKPKKTTVLLVDELDLLCTKKQDVVYNLLDWPTRTHSRLVVLTIANTMDMPERLFKGRVTSRMGLTRLTFMPYTHKQLEEIVLARLNGLNAFVTDAVRLVTRKVAAVSGDARRALDICRRATELPPPDETVKISHIEQAIKEMTNSNTVKIIRNCGQMEKLFLRSLSDISSRSSTEEVEFREVIDQLYALCVLEGFSRPSISCVLSISNRLKCCRLIFSSQSRFGILQRLTLNVTHDDIHYALKT